MTRIHWRLVCGVVLTCTSMARADAGVPMLPIACSGMLLVLVPVVLIEAAVFWRRLAKPFRDCVKAAFSANGLSTVAGIPLTWVLLFVLQICSGGGAYGLETWQKRVFAVTAQSAWLIPYERDLGWMVAASLAFMLIPCFFISVALEQWVVARIWTDLPKKSVRSAVLVGNLMTYVLLAAFLLVQVKVGFAHRG